MRERDKHIEPPTGPHPAAYVRFCYAWECGHCGESVFDEFRKSVPFRSDGSAREGEGFWLPEFHECPCCAMWSRLAFHDDMPDIEE